MNIGTDFGWMLANVEVKVRAIVTAGFAKLVEDVNQYPAVMYRPTAIGIWCSKLDAMEPNMVMSNPLVLTISPTNSPAVSRSLPWKSVACNSNIACASNVPRMPPTHCAQENARKDCLDSCPLRWNARDTIGLKW